MRKRNEISGEVVQSAVAVHRCLGPGLLESAYQKCLAIELRRRGLLFEREKPLSLVFQEEVIPEVYRLDFVIENVIVVEVKSVAKWEPIFDAQILTYLRLTRCSIGLLMNFNVPLMRDGIKRFVYGYEALTEPPVSLW